MALRLKTDPRGVRVRGESLAMAFLVGIVADVYREMGADAIATSCSDGTHSGGSLHWMGVAVDWRTHHLADEVQRQLAADRCRDRLGRDYDVVLEQDHLHTEWHPKGKVP